MHKLPLFTAFIAFAAADMASGGPAKGPIAEIVTYTARDGIRDKDLLRTAQKTETFLRSTGAVLSRSLSRDDTGLWTDYILWTSLDAARATEEQAMERPEFAAFFAMMAEGSAQLRYAQVLMQMD